MKAIEVELTDNQKLVIKKFKTDKVNTDDGIQPTKKVVGVFVRSIEIWVEQINRLLSASGKKDKKNKDLVKFYTMGDTVNKTVNRWCKAIQKDIYIISKMAVTEISK